MISKSLLAGASALALALPTPAAAGSDGIVGGIIGGIIGGAIANQSRAQPRYVAPRRTTRTTSRAPSVSSGQRQENREVQTALSYFGFDAGTPDGVLGRRSRSAVTSMEAFLSMPADGTLTSFERDILLGAHARATSGNPETARLISTSPLGVRAALKAQHVMMTGGAGTTVATVPVGYPGLPLEVSGAVDEIAASSDPSAEQLLQRAGFVQLADLNGDGSNDYILDTSYAGSSFWCSASACKTLVFVSTPQGYARNDMLAHSPTAASFACQGASCRLAETGGTIMTSAPQQPVPSPALPQIAVATPVLPSFGAPPVATVSLASHCGKVSLLTATRGGFVDVAAGGDAEVALAEQFCLARNFAIDQGEQMIAAMPGTTMADVKAQCGGLGAAMTAQLASLAAKPEASVVTDVAAFAQSTGMAPAQLRTTATLCLSAGYADDDLDAALGSAMLLVAGGSAPYAELVAQHLHSGIGTMQRPDLAKGWFDAAFDALKGGAQPVFAPNQAGRTDLVIWAAGGEGPDASGPAAIQPVQAALPTFAAPSLPAK